ncbi:hypothetical protein C2S51_021559 [Perilla frutescens var. frutescens]|nr:hypothetical protein C2S51_021559 [Perilla frutescens var. frutescens]
MAEEAQKNELRFTVPFRVEAKNEAPSDSQAPFALLNKYGSHLKRLRCSKQVEREQRDGVSSEMGANASISQVLSAVRIMTMAEMILSQKGDVSNLDKAFGFDSGLARRHAEHLKRVLWLLDASEKFSKRQYDQAGELLVLVLSGSVDGHPIETVLKFYGQYLREKIDVERGRIDLEREVELVDVEQAVTDLKSAVLKCQQKLPFCQISHFTGIQAILDSVAAAERIHFIDFGRKIGSYWILVMDALARRKGCHVKQLKISAVCSPNDNVEEIGKLLSSFAESMNLPFVFRIFYSETGHLERDRLELEAGETVAVYMEFCFIASLACPKNVEALLGGLKDLNPRVIVVVDVEANVTASAFTARFKEALLFSSAVFDSQEACLGQDKHFRKIFEKLHFQEVICNGLLSEDDGVGFSRYYKIDFWREYISNFGIVETDLSQPAMYQASLMIKECPSWSSCTLKMNGKSLIIGWNGIPMQFVSAWKFEQE